MNAGQSSWVKPHFRNVVSSAEQLDCLIAEANLEDAHIEMAKPYPALVQRHILLVRTDTISSRLEWTVNGRRREDVLAGGDLILNPAGLTTFPQWDKSVKLCLLAIRPESLERAAEQMDLNPKIELVPSYGFRDSLLAQLIQTVVGEFAEEHPDLLYAETMAYAAMAHLLKTSTTRAASLRDRKGRLSPRALQLVMEFIQENISTRFSLEELASLANLSPVHFARLFRRSTGIPPHRWLLEQRLKRAEDLLRNSKLPISQVAARSGFSDQSHLTRHFRRSRRITPSEFRCGA